VVQINQKQIYPLVCQVCMHGKLLIVLDDPCECGVSYL
jgi:hypothetical protein